MIITTSNPKRSSANSKVTFVPCHSDERVTIELKCANVKRQVNKDSELLKEIVDVAMFINTFHHESPMLRMFRECKARVDVHRYFTNMPKSYWAPTKAK